MDMQIKSPSQHMSLQDMDEFQFSFFGFTAREFINKFYNDLITSWSVVVDQIMLPLILKHVDAKVTDIAVKKLQKKLLNRIFQHGKLDLILKRAQEHTIIHHFAIPRHITLPRDLQNLQPEQYDEDELLTKVAKLTEEIIKLRCELEFVQMEKRKMCKYLELCAEIGDNEEIQT